MIFLQRLALVGEQLEVVVEVVAVLELASPACACRAGCVPSGLLSSCATPAAIWPMRGQLLGVDEVPVHVAQLAPRHVELVADALGLLDHEGQAHRLLGQAAVDGDRLVAAGRVAAGAAVELVLGVNLLVRARISRISSSVGSCSRWSSGVKARRRSRPGQRRRAARPRLVGVAGRRLRSGGGTRPRTRRRAACAAGRARRGADARPAVAAAAHEGLDEQGLARVGRLEAAEHLDRLVVAGDHQDVGVEHAAVQAGALEQAAGQREHPRPPGGRRVPAGLRRGGRVDAAAGRAAGAAPARVRTSSITGGSSGSRASTFLATHGPMNTQRTSSP